MKKGYIIKVETRQIGDDIMEKKKTYTTKRFILSMIALALLCCFLLGTALTAISLLAVAIIGGTVAYIIYRGREGKLQLDYEACPGGLLVSGTTVFETKKIIIPSEVDGVPVIGIKEGVFEDNDRLAQIVLPETLRAIDARAFSGCDSLTEVVLPSSLEYIGDEAFHACTSLKSVTIGQNVRFIGNGAFSDCVALAEISALCAEEIGMQAFYACSSLKEIVITKDVYKIGMAAFYGCTSIENAEVQGGEFIIGGQYVVTEAELSMKEHMIMILTDTYCQFDWVRR